MKTDSIILIIFGCFVIIIGLLTFFLYGKLLPIFVSLLGILLILLGVFRNKGYFNKNYYMAIFSVIALWGLMLLYIYLFRTNEYLEDMYKFYIPIGLLIILMVPFNRGYIRRRKEGNL